MTETKEKEPSKHVTHIKKSRLPGVIWAMFGGLSLLLIAGFACAYFFFHKVSTAPVDRLAEALSTVLGTEVKVSGSTAVLEKSEIGELALVQRKTQAITKYETSWMGSDKVLIVRGDFLVKAGFDLSEGGQWGVLEGRINGPLPKGKVLSVEPVGELEIYFSDSGTLNRLNPQDHASAFNYLINQARRDAENSDIAEEAERALIRRINDRMGEVGEGLEWKKAEVLP
ncbi:MAG: DUF4230 domain-containing protein [Akkermansiaceae bacterium]|nr:DUF4230 domain-containing protein [Akkermansiaceae bacterium]